MDLSIKEQTLFLPKYPWQEERMMSHDPGVPSSLAQSGSTLRNFYSEKMKEKSYRKKQLLSLKGKKLRMSQKRPIPPKSPGPRVDPGSHSNTLWLKVRCRFRSKTFFQESQMEWFLALSRAVDVMFGAPPIQPSSVAPSYREHTR